MTITIYTPLTLIKQVLLDRHREGRDADLELARRVVINDAPSVNYYMGEFSDRIVDYVTKAIYKGKDPRSDMYVILSSPLQSDGTPAWHRVGLYRAYKGCSLQTYTRNICIRELIKLEKKEKAKNSTTEFLDFLDYESLLKCESSTDEISDEEKKLMFHKVKEAYLKLNVRDRLVIKLLVIEKHSALEVFEQLSPYMHPKVKKGETPEEVIAMWTNKQKQDAISLMKGRAVSKLAKQYFDLK